jgi:hypothetical protein
VCIVCRSGVKNHLTSVSLCDVTLWHLSWRWESSCFAWVRRLSARCVCEGWNNAQRMFQLHFWRLESSLNLVILSSHRETVMVANCSGVHTLVLFILYLLSFFLPCVNWSDCKKPPETYIGTVELRDDAHNKVGTEQLQSLATCFDILRGRKPQHVASSPHYSPQ